MSEIIEEVFCPMMNKVIDFGYCNELQMIADNMVMPMAEEKERACTGIQRLGITM